MTRAPSRETAMPDQANSGNRVSNRGDPVVSTMVSCGSPKKQFDNDFQPTLIPNCLSTAQEPRRAGDRSAHRPQRRASHRVRRDRAAADRAGGRERDVRRHRDTRQAIALRGERTPNGVERVGWVAWVWWVAAARRSYETRRTKKSGRVSSADARHLANPTTRPEGQGSRNPRPETACRFQPCQAVRPGVAPT